MKLNYYLVVVSGALSLSLASIGFAKQQSEGDQATPGASGASQSGDMRSTEARGQSVDASMQNQSPMATQNAELVRQAQQKLNAEGYNAGPEDGIWGPRTQAALQKFQRDRGFEANGQLNQETLVALDIEERGAIAGTRSGGGEGAQERTVGVGATDTDDDSAPGGAAGTAESEPKGTQSQ